MNTRQLTKIFWFLTFVFQIFLFQFCTTKGSNINELSELLNIPKEDQTTAKMASSGKSPVKIAGAMKNVMMKGELYGVINLDTISNRKALYGLGPLEYLKGEITIIKGKSYVSTINKEGDAELRQDFKVKAPFFVYDFVENWNERKLPDSILTISNLESYLLKIGENAEPFSFILTGKATNANIHIVNLSDGSKVQSPSDAHIGQVNLSLSNLENPIILGFFSTKHKGVFTHHDTFIHMHLLSNDETIMGHVDDIEFAPGSLTIQLPW